MLQSGHVLLPHFGLINELGQCAFISVDLEPSWRHRLRPTGNYISKVVIPGNLLSEGMMYINCFCITLNPDKSQFKERHVVAFHVTDSLDGDSARGDYVKHIPGVIRPILDWTTHYDPNLH